MRQPSTVTTNRMNFPSPRRRETFSKFLWRTWAARTTVPSWNAMPARESPTESASATSSSSAGRSSPCPWRISLVWNTGPPTAPCRKLPASTKENSRSKNPPIPFSGFREKKESPSSTDSTSEDTGEIGPTHTLYLPAPLLRKGSNRLEILELHQLESPEAELTDTPEL